ncbi:hypothetical protein B0H65DRAFT_443214 [Neurospora tetraspora]|uniref:Uncharacterized protein n=1 Tax=Neurospora tetraspora TaxID=94610 RepID=A0AAE0MRG4_9PEZI|nr:hypothetical protein B0H65DRAFT_443214 [Neurospora tetraspora]
MRSSPASNPLPRGILGWTIGKLVTEGWRAPAHRARLYKAAPIPPIIIEDDDAPGSPNALDVPGSPDVPVATGASAPVPDAASMLFGSLFVARLTALETKIDEMGTAIASSAETRDSNGGAAHDCRLQSKRPAGAIATPGPGKLFSSLANCKGWPNLRRAFWDTLRDAWPQHQPGPPQLRPLLPRPQHREEEFDELPERAPEPFRPMAPPMAPPPIPMAPGHRPLAPAPPRQQAHLPTAATTTTQNNVDKADSRPKTTERTRARFSGTGRAQEANIK